MLHTITYEWMSDPDRTTELELTLDVERDWIGHVAEADNPWSQRFAHVSLLDVQVLSIAGPSPQPSEAAVEQAFLNEYLESTELRKRIRDLAWRH